MTRRWLFGSIACLCLLLFIPSCWASSDGYALRAALTRLSGYDGCMCPDCYAVYGVGPPRAYYGGCGTCRHSSCGLELVLPTAGLASFVLAIVPIVKHPTPGMCDHCGYEIASLPRCPECGREPPPLEQPTEPITPALTDHANATPTPPSRRAIPPG